MSTFRNIQLVTACFNGLRGQHIAAVCHIRTFLMISFFSRRDDWGFEGFTLILSNACLLLRIQNENKRTKTNAKKKQTTASRKAKKQKNPNDFLEKTKQTQQYDVCMYLCTHAVCVVCGFLCYCCH